MVPFLAWVLCQRNVAFAILGCARIGSGPSNALAVGARVPKGIWSARVARPSLFCQIEVGLKTFEKRRGVID
jgi:hypothetical protein